MSTLSSVRGYAGTGLGYVKSGVQTAVGMAAKLRSDAGFGFYNVIGLGLHVNELVRLKTGKVFLETFSSETHPLSGNSFMRNLDAGYLLSDYVKIKKMWKDQDAGERIPSITKWRIYAMTAAHAICLANFLDVVKIADFGALSAKIGLTRVCSLSTLAGISIGGAFILWATELYRSSQRHESEAKRLDEKAKAAQEQSTKEEATKATKEHRLSIHEKLMASNLIMEIAGIALGLAATRFIIPMLGSRFSDYSVQIAGLCAKGLGCMAFSYGTYHGL